MVKGQGHQTQLSLKGLINVCMYIKFEVAIDIEACLKMLTDRRTY